MIKKIILIVAIVGSGLIFFTNKTKASESYSYDNLASPDLQGKEYLGNGEYLLTFNNGGTLTYNVYSGVYRLFGDIQGGDFYYYFGYDRPYPNDNYIQVWKVNQIGDFNGALVFFGGGSDSQVLLTTDNDYQGKYSNNGELTNQIFSFNSTGLIDVSFKLQLEKGTTATPYQVPIQALEQHVQLEKEKSYNDGYNDGLNEGYIQGFNDGLLEAFNLQDYLGQGNNENITFKSLGTNGPGNEWFGYDIKVNVKINSLVILNLNQFTLLRPINYSNTGYSQRITLSYVGGGSTSFIFHEHYNSFEQDIHFLNKDTRTVSNINIALAHNGTSGLDWSAYDKDIRDNVGLYLNDNIYKGDYISKIKTRSFDAGYLKGWNAENNVSFNKGFGEGYELGNNEGYAQGVNDNIKEGGFANVLIAGFSAIGAILSVELLPNISIGSIVAIPIVFGVVMFIIGRRKE